MKKLARHTIEIWVAVVAITLLCTVFLYKDASDHELSIILKEQESALNESRQLAKAWLNFPKRDALYLSKIEILQEYIDNESDENREGLESWLSLFISTRQGLYGQVRYIDNNGIEKVKLENRGNSVYVFEKEELQDKKQRYYFNDAIQLNKNEIYISPIDLNIEEGKIETPHKPVVRFGIRVFDKNGLGHGVIVINYLGEPLLSRLKNIIPQLSDIKFGITNKNGYWIAHPDAEREWGFMLSGRSENKLSIEHPEQWENIKSNSTEKEAWFDWAGGYASSSQFSQSNELLELSIPWSENKSSVWYLISWITREDYIERMKPIIYRYIHLFFLLSIVFGFICIFISMSLIRRKKTKVDEAVRDAHLRTSIATEAAGIGIWEYYISEQAMIWDEKMLDIYGVESNEFTGSVKDWKKLLHPDDLEKTNKELVLALKEKQHFSTEFRIITPAGKTRSIKATAQIFRDSSGRAERMIGATLDLSDKAFQARKLQKARKKAELLAKTKGDFLANMSHEIRTPMNAIIGLSDLALQTSDLTPKLRDYLNKICMSSKALLMILNDILDLSKIEAGRLDINQEEFNPEYLISNIVDLFSIRADQKNIDLNCSMSPDIPLRVLGDQFRLAQVLNNLVGNALKFTDFGSIIVRIDLVSEDDQSVKMQFSVKDTGIGISREQKKKLFEPFQQADSSITRSYGGTGLGLTISQQLVTRMGGKISLKSEIGDGSTFSFVLEFPVVQSKHCRFDGKLAEVKALVVDDSEISRDILSEMLGSWNIVVTKVDSASSAIDALVAAGDAPFDLVLLDWKMPDTDGLATIEEIYELSKNNILPRTPAILMLTAFDKDELLKKTDKIESYAVLTKPVAASEMFNVLMKMQEGTAPNSTVVEPVNLYNLAASIHGARILLVEDNDINQTVACDLLDQMGLDVTVANNGKIALEYIETNVFDAVLMDLQMPVMDGFETSRKIRSKLDYQSLPIIAMTAAVLSDDRDQCKTVGMNSHVNKPIDPINLLENLLKWIKPKFSLHDSSFKSQNLGDQFYDANGSRRFDDVNIQGLNTSKAARILNGNFDLFTSLLVQIYKQGLEKIESAEYKFRVGDSSEAVIILHSIRGVLGNIGATELVRSMSILERIIENNLSDDSEIVFNEIKQQFSELLLEIGIYLSISLEQKNSTSNKEKTKVRPADSESFKHLLGLLEAQDISAIEVYKHVKPEIFRAVEISHAQGLDTAIEELLFSDAAKILRELSN